MRMWLEPMGLRGAIERSSFETILGVTAQGLQVACSLAKGTKGRWHVGTSGSHPAPTAEATCDVDPGAP